MSYKCDCCGEKSGMIPHSVCAPCFAKNNSPKQLEKPEVSPSNSKKLLNSLIVKKEEYRKSCDVNNPDHWGRGHRQGYLDGLEMAISKIKLAI